MLIIIISCIFFWMFFQAFRMAWKMAWGFMKISAMALFVLALPLFIICLFGGNLIPLLGLLATIVLLFVLLKAFLNV